VGLSAHCSLHGAFPFLGRSTNYVLLLGVIVLSLSRRKFCLYEEVFHPEGGDALNRLPREVVDAPSLCGCECGCGCGSGQPGLVVGNPAYSGG